MRMAASPTQLVVLDVDGTLVHSLDAEASLFPRACESALALDNVRSDWGSYRCPSDRGIVRELVERNYHRSATADDYELVERHFLTLIQRSYAQDPTLCPPVAGAISAVEALLDLHSLGVQLFDSALTALSMRKCENHAAKANLLHVQKAVMEELAAC